MMAHDICESPQITRLSLGRDAAGQPRTGYQINDPDGRWVVLPDDLAAAAASFILADLRARHAGGE